MVDRLTDLADPMPRGFRQTSVAMAGIRDWEAVTGAIGARGYAVLECQFDVEGRRSDGGGRLDAPQRRTQDHQLEEGQ